VHHTHNKRLTQKKRLRPPTVQRAFAVRAEDSDKESGGLKVQFFFVRLQRVFSLHRFQKNKNIFFGLVFCMRIEQLTALREWNLNICEMNFFLFRFLMRIEQLNALRVWNFDIFEIKCFFVSIFDEKRAIECSQSLEFEYFEMKLFLFLFF